MGEIEEFNTLTFEKKLMQLKDTQESIQSLSSWCLKQRSHHKKIVASWLNVLKRVKVEQRLVLFYLANDVIQYSKRKNYEFVESWGLNLQKATPLVRDEKVRKKILRIFKIWEQRSVYDEEFLSDLTGLLSAGAIKKTDDDPLDFQPQQLVNKIKQCSVLESDTDLKLKCIHDSHLQLSDADALCSNLKDRSLKDDVEKELNEGIACVERYTQALQREIVAREALLALLTSANQYYSTQRGEVKVVAHAYKNFGARVRALKRKLDELIPTMPSAAPSPPQRDEDVPSPGPDEDLDLPVISDTADDELAYNIDQSFNTTLGPDGSLYNLGLSSFLTSDNPLSIFNESNETDLVDRSSNKIEVINSRPSEKQDFNINDFLKTFAPTENSAVSDNNSVGSATLSQKSQDALPGLDLLTPESTGNPPPPTSFYGTMDNIVNDETEQPYIPEIMPNEQWNRNDWSLQQRTSPSRSVFADTPESPPPAPRSLVPPRALRTDAFVQDLPPADVDHRGVLPPPPPPPILPLLGHLEDVDHRLLPNMQPPPLPIPSPLARHPGQHHDVDHRNLISLTHQLPLPARSGDTKKVDQDYRMPTMVPPPDIVESVDMDLSEDEDQLSERIYPQPESRHNSYNNNKVLVGGDNGKTIHEPSKTNHESIHSNLIQINSVPRPSDVTRQDGPHSAPVGPISNPFEKLPHQTPRLDSNTFEKVSHSTPRLSALNPFEKLPQPTPRLDSNTFEKVPHSIPRLTASNPFEKLPHQTPGLDSNTFEKVPHSTPRLSASNSFEKLPHSSPGLPALNSFKKLPHPIAGVPTSNLFEELPHASPVSASNPFEKTPHTAPVAPMSNPFDKMPPGLKFMQQNSYQNHEENRDMDDSAFEDDMRTRNLEMNEIRRSPPGFNEFASDADWSQNPGHTMNKRFPRNWVPRHNFRPQNFSPPFYPRHRLPQPNRWMGPRPQRFW